MSLDMVTVVNAFRFAYDLFKQDFKTVLYFDWSVRTQLL